MQQNEHHWVWCHTWKLHVRWCTPHIWNMTACTHSNYFTLCLVIHLVRTNDHQHILNKPTTNFTQQLNTPCTTNVHVLFRNIHTSPRIFDCHVAGLPVATVVSNLVTGETNCNTHMIIHCTCISANTYPPCSAVSLR